MQCGVGVTYFIFVAENIATLFPSANLPTAVLIGAMACVEMPLVLFKRIAKLHATNAAGNVLAACCLFSVFGVFVYFLPRGYAADESRRRRGCDVDIPSA